MTEDPIHNPQVEKNGIERLSGQIPDVHLLHTASAKCVMSDRTDADQLPGQVNNFPDFPDFQYPRSIYQDHKTIIEV